MFKSLMVAASVAVSALTLAPAAEAHSRSGVTIYFGVPFHSYQVGPGWRYYDGYGWYDYGRYGDFRQHRNRLSCNQARRLVDRRFDRVRVRDCSGRTYTFSAVNRNGKRVIVYVNSRTGAIWRG
jgi:hypothetical protein